MCQALFCTLGGGNEQNKVPVSHGVCLRTWETRKTPGKRVNTCVVLLVKIVLLRKVTGTRRRECGSGKLVLIF